MSMVREIFEELWNTELRYRGVRVNVFSIPRFKKYSPQSLQATVDRLARQKLIHKEDAGIILSVRGREYVKKKLEALRDFGHLRQISKTKTLLVMFDVPVERKAEREWLRWHLKKFGFEMIQRSVWVGPDPLPKEFQEYIKEIHLADCIKKFRLSKPYSAK